MPFQYYSDAQPVIGREAEIEALKEIYRTACGEGQGPRLAVVDGPKGVGKTRLMVEFKRQLQSRGEVVLEGACVHGPQPAYGPFRDIVGQALGLMEGLGLRRISAEDLSLLSVLVPGLPEASASQEAAPLLKEEQRRLKFFDAVSRTLMTLSGSSPLVVLLHDLHWADQATLDLLRYLLQALFMDPEIDFGPSPAGAFRGLLVMAVRSEEGGGAEVLEGVPFTSLPLRGLDREAVRRLLQSPQVINRILESTDGLPHHIEEVIRSLPDNVEDLFLRRVRLLPDKDRLVLEAMAVAGKSLTVDEIASLSGHPREGVVSSIQSLIARRMLVRQVESGSLVFSFDKEINREALYQSLDESRAKLLHARVGAFFEEASMHQPGVCSVEEMAEHYLKGAIKSKALEYSLLAGERLSIAFSFGRAAQMFEQALLLASEDDQWREIVSRLIDLYGLSGDVRKALRYAGMAVGRADEAERAGAYRQVAELLMRQGRHGAAGRVIERSHRELRAGDPEGVRILSLKAELFYLTGRHERALEVVQLGHEQADRFTSDEVGLVRVSLDNTAGKVLMGRGDLYEAAERFSANLKRASRLSWVAEEIRALVNLGIVTLKSDDLLEARGHFQRALERCEVVGDAHHRALCLLNLGTLHHHSQEFAAAIKYFHEAISAFKRTSNRTQLARTAANLANIYLHLGQVDRSQRLAAFGARMAKTAGVPHLEAYAKTLEGEIQMDLRRLDEAERAFLEAREGFKGCGSLTSADEVAYNLARLALQRGNAKEARQWLASMEGPDQDSSRFTASIMLLRGELELGSSGARALPHFLRAWEAYDALGDDEGRVRSLLMMARACRANGDRDRAMAHLSRASRHLEGLLDRIPPEYHDAYLARRDRWAVEAERKELEGELGQAAQASRQGPLKTQLVLERRGREAEARTQQWDQRYGRIIGQSSKVFQIFRVLDKVAATDSSVLILGESGTGKELVAEAIHRNSPRQGRPFIKVNCAALVESLLLSELFGHEKGAFTGAISRKKGRFELASGGTIFLDEIGDISPKTQVSLLRVLQEREFERVGGCQPIHVDVRIVCATNRNLEELVRAGEFRADLYYRLRGVVMEMPPLRERPEDLPLLVDHFIHQIAGEGPRKEMDRGALELLAVYDWPGNIRELENMIRSVMLFSEGPVIREEDFSEYRELFQRRPAPVTEMLSCQCPEEALVNRVLFEDMSLVDLKRKLEVACIDRALEETGGNITQAAKLLKMKRPRLSQLVKEYGLKPALG